MGREGEDGEHEGEEGAKRKMEKEFRIGATGASDSLGEPYQHCHARFQLTSRDPVRIANLDAIRNSSV